MFKDIRTSAQDIDLDDLLYSDELSSKEEKIDTSKIVYRCPYCNTTPEISNIFYTENKIFLECPLHQENCLKINNYLNKLKYNTCHICYKRVKSEEYLYYCNQCEKNICSVCKKKHSEEHSIINLNEYNIKCRIHYEKTYGFYCCDCSSNLCEICFTSHDKDHDIIPLSDLFLKKEELDYILKKNEEYNEIIQRYRNYITLNNLILEAYNNLKYNYNYIINAQNLIQFIKKFESLNTNNITQKNLEKNIDILGQFNKEYETELTFDSDKIYLNWKEITSESLEYLVQIEFNKMREFQSVGTRIDDLSFLKNAKFPILQELYLTDNKICDISILDKVNFPILKIIYLNKNKIKEINVFKKVHFPELTKLYLDDNNITDISVLQDIPCSKLENIKLRKNLISDISPLDKIKLKFLRILDIKKNKIDYKIQKNLDIIDELRDKSIRIVY